VNGSCDLPVDHLQLRRSDLDVRWCLQGFYFYFELPIAAPTLVRHVCIENQTLERTQPPYARFKVTADGLGERLPHQRTLRNG
jgi:hypothetical protein